MNKQEITLLALFGAVLVAVVVFHIRGGSLATAPDDVGMSQEPESANQTGPAYLVATMPYGYGPPVTMQAPYTSQGFLGQTAPLAR